MKRAANAFTLVVVLATAASCASFRAGRGEPDEAAIVQVREYPQSSTVDVVAWAPEDNNYGLHAMVRRDGTLVRDHRLYVSTLYLGTGFFRNAGATFRPGEAFRRRRFVEMIAPFEELLQTTGISRDVQSCYGWPRCSPFQTGGARVPDSLLRASRDSMSVRFYDSSGSELVLTVRRDVIDPYLKAVDSVATALRKH